MGGLSSLGFRTASGPSRHSEVYQQQVAHILLQRVLEFTGWTIDDVVSNPVARNEVLGYYRLARWLEDRCEELGLAVRLENGRISL